MQSPCSLSDISCTHIPNAYNCIISAISTPPRSPTSVAGEGYCAIIQHMPSPYLVCLVTQLRYVPVADSWWITVRITAGRGERCSAVLAEIDLPTCERLILQAVSPASLSTTLSVQIDLCTTGKSKITTSYICWLLPEPGINANVIFPNRWCLGRLNKRGNDLQNCPLPTLLNEMDVPFKSNNQQMSENQGHIITKRVKNNSVRIDGRVWGTPEGKLTSVRSERNRAERECVRMHKMTSVHVTAGEGWIIQEGIPSARRLTDITVP